MIYQKNYARVFNTEIPLDSLFCCCFLMPHAWGLKWPYLDRASWVKKKLGTRVSCKNPIRFAVLLWPFDAAGVGTRMTLFSRRNTVFGFFRHACPIEKVAPKQFQLGGVVSDSAETR
jgi:hypothetical protein